MKSFTGWQYLLIDVANNSALGLDKKTFEERIQWAEEHLTELESHYSYTWKNRPLYIKAVQAVRKAQQGIPTGHLMGFDAVCSGMQIMSVLAGCHDGARATGLVDPDRRADAYTDCTDIMTQILGYEMPHARSKAKDATMKALYGSRKEPKLIFGEDTPEHNAFWQALYKLCPGACMLLETLINTWQPFALSHSWSLPDGYRAFVKVMQPVETKIEVDELGHTTFGYRYFVNEGEESGVKNAANVIHSIDAYVLRCLVRRCNYDREIMLMASDEIGFELLSRDSIAAPVDVSFSEKALYYYQLYLKSGIADPVVVPHLTTQDIQGLPYEYLRTLNRVISTMLDHQPFEILTVHDDFKCHPNNMNHLRKHYRDILVELANSDIISMILADLHGYKGHYPKISYDLAPVIQQSNYALC